MKHAAPGANLVFRPEMLEVAAVYCLRHVSTGKGGNGNNRKGIVYGNLFSGILKTRLQWTERHEKLPEGDQVHLSQQQCRQADL